MDKTETYDAEIARLTKVRDEALKAPATQEAKTAAHRAFGEGSKAAGVVRDQ